MTKRNEKNDKLAPAPYADDLAYLEDELQWIEARLVGLGHQARSVAGPNERRSPFDEDEATPTQHRRRATAAFTRAQGLRAAIDANLAATRDADVELGLDKLCATHGLDDFERNVLLLATAPVFSRRFEELFEKTALNPARCGLGVEVVFDFTELSFRDRILRRHAFAPGSPLVKNELISVGMVSRLESAKDLLDASLELSSGALGTILGNVDLDAQFAEFSSLEEPRATFDQVILAPEDKERILAVVDRREDFLAARARYGFDDIIQYGRGSFMLFHGEPGTGKTLTAHAVAARLGRRVLNVDIPMLADKHESQRILPALFRAARVRNAVLFFDECEAIFASRRFGNDIMTVLLAELERFDGLAILATNMPEALDEALARRILVRVHFPRPDIEAREALWRAHLPATAPLAADVDLRALATRFEMTGGFIKNAVLASLAAAVQADGAAPVITMRHLERAAAQQSRSSTGERPSIVHPRARLADVVLPPDVGTLLGEIVDATRNRATVLDRWKIAPHMTYGRGIAALFHGPPGTGKTLSAEAIAGELNRPLLVASVPSLQSMWVGETEKRLVALFEDVRAERAVLFLDEADSLLMARGEGRASRHDDSQVNVLLGLIERHDDLILLATNRPGLLDPALSRRIAYHVAFPQPDARARAAIWRGLVPDSVPTEGGIDFERLGSRFALSGGEIKNAVLKAAFRAAARQVLRQADLEGAASEEQATNNGDSARPIGFARSEAAA
ncbi:MAG: ATP-binding protein [Deltaproteobacteria bacterium]|nr:MAG: ATP-binding protein [Deltaproteobacteria bacterium]